MSNAISYATDMVQLFKNIFAFGGMNFEDCLEEPSVPCNFGEVWRNSLCPQNMKTI